jgi:16S rRNA pseudouridine516 synthase
MQLQDILYSQGFGTRRVCCGLIQQGHVSVWPVGCADNEGVQCLDPLQFFEPLGLWFSVDGERWPYHERAYILLHKPLGTECSHKPAVHPSIYTLLPAPLRQRPGRGAISGVQAVGRLDQDTTGLLVLSDDGQFIHKMSSPKKKVPKVYEVTVKHEIRVEQIRQLLEGVMLHDEYVAISAAACKQTGSHTLELTLTQGKFHQVKRMVASVGNRVEQLHRFRIGALDLPQNLAPGQWYWLRQEDLSALTQSI